MLGRIWRNRAKFKSLQGVVAIIFTIFFIHNFIALCFNPLSMWALLSTILVGIFAYWSINATLGSAGSCGCRSRTRKVRRFKWGHAGSTRMSNPDYRGDGSRKSGYREMDL